MRNSLILVVKAKHLAETLEAISNAAGGWESHQPAVRLIEKIEHEGGAKALALKIGLDTSIRNGGWQTHLTRSGSMTLSVTQTDNLTFLLTFWGEGVQGYRSTFFTTLIESIRSFLVNAQDYPELVPAV